MRGMDKVADRSDDYPWTERVSEAIGHDPARFLDRPLHTTGIGDDYDGLRFIEARIKGIRRLKVVHLYKRVEKNLAKRQDREPRDEVMDLLDTQESLIQEFGDLEEYLQEAPRRDPEPTESVVRWPDRDGGERTSSFTRSGRHSFDRAATDGGERQ